VNDPGVRLPAEAAETVHDGPPEREAGSFRDRNGTVFYRGERVYRALSGRALANWQRLSQTPFFERHRRSGAIVDTHTACIDGLPHAAGMLEHARIPFVSYPYEWTFGMLKDAALLQLELLRDALSADMILKDATPYNVQWDGARPVFIDVPSFEPLEKGQPWVGYRQFCELCLYPLMLQAYKGIDYRPWLRGRINGIPADEMHRLMSARDLVRPGVLLHVAAQSALQRRYAGGRSANVRGSLAEAGFDKRLIDANVAKLSSLVSRLAPKAGMSEWSEYGRTHSYEPTDFERKLEFVRRAAATRRWRLAWDLGCNTGTFSRIAAEHADYVVAMDGDWRAIEALYQREKDEGSTRPILPLVIDLADASPNQGWLGRERKGLAERGGPQLTLCLAVLHHVVISANIPLAEFIDWLADSGTAIVIEFVGREDEMVQILLRNREDQYDDYNPATFRRLLENRFEIEAEQPLKDGKRHIYFARPKSYEL
jgi:SAM-dependent methyltransferase